MMKWDLSEITFSHFLGELFWIRYVMAVCHFANLLSNIGFEIVVFKNVNILVESEYETSDALETTYVDVQTIVLVAEGSDVSLGFGVFLEEYILGERSKIELKNKSFKTPGDLVAAGLEVAIITDSPVIPLCYLPLCAGLAVKSGLSEEEAWKAITINPARQTGIGDRVGSLEPGKDGDVVIWEADPLTTVGAGAWMTVVDGKVVHQK
jgi:imidazolonepropionase-like amidohydrolase